MTAFLPLFVLIGLALVVLALGFLVFRAKRAPSSSLNEASTPWWDQDMARRHALARTKPMSLDGGADDEGDAGPETVLSYMDVPALRPRQPDTEETSPNIRPPVFSLTMPQALTDLEAGHDAARERIERALQLLGEGPVDQAWASIKGFVPDAANRQVALETFERVALAYERANRFDVARDVYEHMADIAPDFRQVKVRLMRVRGLAQAATANAWGTLPPRPLPAEPQQQLGKYVVERQIGKGAMGAVYLGYDPVTDRRVALKTMALAQEFSGDELADARMRFLREAEMAGRLQHPDIVSILDAGEQEGVAYIAMELVEGVDLSQHAQPATLLPLTQLLPIMARVAEALAYAHTRGVTHRDVKPANIMVDVRTGLVKVMDFGVARVADAARTRTGVVLGTPTFMSPEQLAGQNIDGRSDLYSLGITLFQLVTGQVPYRNDSMAVLMRAIAQDPVPDLCALSPDLPRALGDVVALALQKHPQTRYPSGHDMALDLLAVARSLQPVDIPL